MADTKKIETLPIRQVPDVRHLLINHHAREQIANVAAGSIRPDRLMHLLINVVRRTPKLGQCEPMSFLGAVMELAQLGLEPNTPLGHAWILPFENSRKVDGQWVKITEAQVIIGYLGMIELMLRSDRVASIMAEVVYSDDDVFDWELGASPKLRHVPGPQKGDLTHAYVVIRSNDGQTMWSVMNRAQIEARRDMSQNWQAAVKYGKTDRSAWVTNTAAMWKKTVVRAAFKFAPKSIEASRALEIDSQKLDYRAFAAEPSSGGAPYAGTTIDIEPEEMPEGDIADAEHDDREPEPKADPKPKAEKPAPEAKPTAKDAARDDEQMQAMEDLAGRVIEDMTAVGAVGLLDAIDMHRDSLEILERDAPHLKAKVDKAFETIQAGKG